MKKNLILNFFTLSVTCLLLIFVVMAWYITNEQVSVTGIVGSTEGDRFSLELERGEYNNGTWEWQETKSLAISNMQPGDVFFFRFKITVLKQGQFSTQFTDIESKIDPEVVLARAGEVDDYYVSLNGNKYVNMNSAGTLAQVSVGADSEHSETKTLYSYDSEQATDYEKFSLVDFKVEDTFNFYDYGIGDSTFLYDDNVENDSTGYAVVIDAIDYNRHLVSNRYYLKVGDEYVLATGDYTESFTYYSYDEVSGTYTEETNGYAQLQRYRQSLVSDKYYVRSGSGTNQDPYTYAFATGTFTPGYNYYVASPSTNIRSIPLVGATTSYQINELGIKYQYFALEFNDELSIKTYLHQDGTYKADSNLYQAQILSIRKIGLKEN